MVKNKWAIHLTLIKVQIDVLYFLCLKLRFGIGTIFSKNKATKSIVVRMER